MSGGEPGPERVPGAGAEAESAGLDLLLRIVQEEVRSKACPACAAPLADCEMNLREPELDRVVVEVACRSCERTLLMTIAPDGESGVATVR
ncbi:hypothetical protein EPN29_10775 [bacterium]|nr:MAG: hypothetical protein EPN29_10775 [bacterium]